MEQSGFKSLLKNRNFLLLWSEQILSQFAYNLVNFALMIWVFKLTQSSFAESLLVLSFILPTAIFSVFTGVIADLYDRRKIMLIIHIIWAILVLSFIFIRNNFILILIFSFILNMIDRFFTPAEQASLPQIVGEKNLLIANSLFSFSLNAGFLFGFSLAGPMMLIWGNDIPFFLSSFLIAIGLVFIFFLPPLKSTRQRADLSFTDIIPETKKQIIQGYLFVKRTRIIILAIAVFTVIQIVMNSSMALAPSFVVNNLGFIDPKHASWVVMFPVGLGTILAIILLRFWQNKLKRWLIKEGVLLSGISFLGLGIISLMKLYTQNINFYPFIFISCLMLGACATLILVPVLTIISQYTPNEYLGRVWGVANLVQNTAASVPLLIVGALADRISIIPLLFGVAFIAFIIYTFSKRVENNLWLGTNQKKILY